MGGGTAGDFGRTKGSGKRISNPIVDNKRVGSAKKTDRYHSFSNIVDNYASLAKTFKIKGGDGIENAREALSYEVGNKRLKDIIDDMKIIDRSF